MVNVSKLKGKMVEKGISAASLAELVGINKSTFYRKLRNTDFFTIGEVSAIVRILGLSHKEAVAIFFTPLVA